MNNFRTDDFRIKTTAIEFIEAEVEARIKEYDVQVFMDGKRVAASVEFKKGVVIVDVENPVFYLKERL